MRVAGTVGTVHCGVDHRIKVLPVHIGSNIALCHWLCRLPYPEGQKARDTLACVGALAPSRRVGVRLAPPADVKYKPSPFLLIVVVILSITNLALASSHSANTGFKLHALNMNGLGGPGKLHHVNSVIAQRSPHSFVISKTKTNEKLSSKLPSFEYNIFEEEAVPLSGDSKGGHKWGVAVGIRKDIQVSQRVVTSKASFRGRLLAIDIILPTDSGVVSDTQTFLRSPRGRD
ncbi:hypothetical protein R3P38DRAFT_3204423 [Favolaschia claudopus]|uniref:Uncharacterized protein n=1 Tax=Favolaschia claudopus TaxID=2862362 RepID=A0AAW0AQ31_9AGAR